MSYYEGKQVLVTGGHGFLGKRLVQRLHELGADVAAPDRSEYDLVSEDDVAKMADRYAREDVLFHLAAHVGGIEYSGNNPAPLFYDNLMMGANLINQLGMSWEVERSVFVGSVCSYPLYCPLPTLESYIGNGEPEPSNGAYGWAKLAVGKMLQAYHAQDGIKAAWPILANMYGPGDHYEPWCSHVIPALIRKFSDAAARNAPEVEVWGSGRATRDFLYVDDAVEALLLCGEEIDEPEPINIAGGQQVSVLYLARKIAELVGYSGEVVFNRDMPEGQPNRQWNIKRAERLLGWVPTTEIDVGLQRAVEDYKGRVDGHTGI